MLAMLLSFISLVASYVPSHIRSTLKHPMIIAVSLWALSHLLANGDLGSVIMFGSFLIWGVTARINGAESKGNICHAITRRAIGVS